MFFYTFGDFFYSIIFNFNTLIDTIPSGFFTFTKTHTLFMTFSLNLYLHETLMALIYLLILAALVFLLTLTLTFNTSYFKRNFIYEIVLVAFIIFILF